MFLRISSLILVFLFGLAAPVVAANVVIDHSNWDSYDSASSEQQSQLARNRYFFAHASVGSNIVDGLDDLHGASPGTYMLSTRSSGATPPATADGTFYEYARGNPGWAEKVSSFATYVGNGWQAPNVNFAINKFCYIDQDADFATYRDSMAGLESAHPDTIFVYMTMPLTTDDNSEAGHLRQQFNESLRSWIAGQDNKCLLDIADIEAHSPSGEEQTSSWNGHSYQKLHSGYTDDGGHLNAAGRVRVAKALYSLFAAKLGSSPTPSADYVVTFHSTANGNTSLLYFAGTSLSGMDPSFTAPLEWSPCCSCDFNGNGSPDQVWQHSSGLAVIVAMNGAAILEIATLGTYPDSQPKACGDFNNDGHSDIAWRETSTGNVVAELMYGLCHDSWNTVLALPDMDWGIRAAGDFNADGTHDLVFRNSSSGQNAIVLLNDAAYSGMHLIPEVPVPAYSLEAAADVDSDGDPDIIWFSPGDGALYVEYMSGHTHLSYGALTLGFTIPSGWEPFGAADY